MNSYCQILIYKLGLKNQILISKAIDLGLYEQALSLNEVDYVLKKLYLKLNENLESKKTFYIWLTQGDSKVRESHKENEGKIFSYENPPPTGNPGEDYGCRCWSETYEINDPPIENVYPELLLLPLLRVGRDTVALASKLVREFNKPINSSDKLTQHGALRSFQRKITQSETEIAIETAKKSGNITKKIGKYGTPQSIYKGSNGVTVIVEEGGRNAGKIITFWRH